MKKINCTSVAAVGFAAAAVLSISACSSDSGDSSSSTAAPMSAMTSMATSTSAMSPASDLVGPGCADYAKKVPSGPGSVTGMATAPVAVAASNNPLLTTLTSAVSGKLNPQVNLVDTLNGSEFTVFAPVDEAFAKIDSATIDGLKTNSAELKKILTYHVVPGQLSPSKVDGTHKTVEGATLAVTGSGNDIKVNGASVICGGVHTANATVYLIDTVLMPPAS
ncbi:fasciclin domain-containing protein [Gordonia sp. TBRC 11910]|uniref:Fasciclin domain-containing protein n=1 Tax=Gordonia asplenii TaxID=2725283 RepID=A0A848KZ81_9ACTN|nr:fasciclin domain-containing protein [Gordonia asplenii]NMO04024.1 fasciclin domain-containing protein [Gordonia asplenii]